MSLCFGLAAGSRPPLIATATAHRARLLDVASTRAAWAAARGTRGALRGMRAPVARLQLRPLWQPAGGGSVLPACRATIPGASTSAVLSYLLPNLWYYGISPPRPTILFPFLALTPPPLTYPLGLPANYMDARDHRRTPHDDATPAVRVRASMAASTASPIARSTRESAADRRREPACSPCCS